MESKATVRVWCSDETRQALNLIKRPSDTYDDVLRRLLAEHDFEAEVEEILAKQTKSTTNTFNSGE